MATPRSAAPSERRSGLRSALLGTSLKSRLILYSLSVTFFVLVSLLAISFLTLRLFLRENLVETTTYKLRVAVDHIDRDVDRLAQLVNWCTVSIDVQTFVASTPAYPADRRFKALAAHRSVRDAVYANGLDSYVDKLLVGGFEGHSLQVGLVQGDIGDFAAARRAYEASAAAGGLGSWRGIEREPFFFAGGADMIPFARTVESDDGASRPIGFAFMAVNTSVLARYLSGYDLEPGARLFIAIGDSAYEIRGGRDLVAIPGGRAAGWGRDAVSCEGQRSGWTLAQTLPTVQLTRQNRVFAWLLALMAGAVGLLVFLLLANFDRIVTGPIRHIGARVTRIAAGDFSHDPGIERDDELGDIGRAVNAMSRDIEGLIERRVQDEKAKKDLEFRMLQNQINPHFMYNALSAMKWMAEIQKAPGIAEMASALASLLRHAARDAGALVSLESELELVREYCVVQRYRSANLFELEIEVADDSLLRCSVLRFMLQPIVENAIMHGIEPKMAPGKVRIEADAPGGRLRVVVGDDGVGMEPELAARLLEAGVEDRETFNRIGLYNVHERLRLAFGEGYGLSVDSRPGLYTRVTLLMPRIVEGGPAPGAAPAAPAGAAERPAGA